MNRQLPGALTTLLVPAAGGLLLRRMAREFHDDGAFSRSTVALLAAAYTTHAAWATRGLAQEPGTLPLPRRPAKALGPLAGLAGLALVSASFARFQSVAQLWGSETGGLVTGGPYRFTRNPQYVGYILLWTGAGVARRSQHGLAAAITYALAIRAWLPVEERHLTETFGEEYRQWAAQRPRWL